MGENIANGYLATPEMGAGPALIVVQDLDVAAAHSRDVCDRFAEEGFTALAPDLGNGQPAAALVEAIDVLKPHPAVRGQGVGVVGFGMGAGLALWLGTHRPGDIVALVPFYGVPSGVEQPDWSHLSAAVQGHFGEEDPSCPPETVSALEAALGEAGVTVEMFAYPTAGAAFFDDTRADVYAEDAARQAWIRTLEFLRKHLG
jgi:carboxymethylenebutenolidase